MLAKWRVHSASEAWRGGPTLTAMANPDFGNETETKEPPPGWPQSDAQLETLVFHPMCITSR